MGEITFETQLFKIKDWTILRLPEDASAKLPSRGMTMVKGAINNAPFITMLEPDGVYGQGKKPSHWFRVDKILSENAKGKTGLPAEALAKAGDTIRVDIEPTKEWIEPVVPDDIIKMLKSSPKAETLWVDITPLARWDWIRWVRAVKTKETREKHLQVMLDKLNKGMRRPCCFNRNLCSEPYVSKNWVLLDAA